MNRNKLTAAIRSALGILLKKVTPGYNVLEAGKVVTYPYYAGWHNNGTA